MIVEPPGYRYQIESALKHAKLLSSVLEEEKRRGKELAFVIGYKGALRPREAAITLPTSDLIFLRTRFTAELPIHEALHYLHPGWTEDEIESESVKRLMYATRH